MESVLVHVSEVINQYVTALSKLPRFFEVRAHWEKPKADDSVAKKLADVATHVVGESEYLVAGAALLVHWRNRIVHKSSKAKLLPKQKGCLRDNEQVIAEKYKSLSVDRLLSHFDEQRPTLKDVSSLIAMTINLARKLDQEICKSFEEDELDAWLTHYGISNLLEKVKAETSPEKLEESVRRVFQTHAPQLWEPYERIQLNQS